MSATTESIYGLFYDDFRSPQHLQEGPDEVLFYVGRTTNIEKRMKQHLYEAGAGTEDKYVFMRDLKQKNIEWHHKVLQAVCDSDNRPWEYFYVIESIRKGSPLKNMRYGDFQHISSSRLNLFAADKSICTVDDLKEKLKKEEVENQPIYKASDSVQLRAILRSLRWLRLENDERNGDVRKWNIYDLGEGTEEIKTDFYMTKKQVAEFLAPGATERQQELIKLLHG